MSLDDYKVERDKFQESSFSSGYSFPCCVCEHRDKDQMQNPCRYCDHNMNSLPDGE